MIQRAHLRGGAWERVALVLIAGIQIAAALVVVLTLGRYSTTWVIDALCSDWIERMEGK